MQEIAKTVHLTVADIDELTGLAREGETDEECLLRILRRGIRAAKDAQFDAAFGAGESRAKTVHVVKTSWLESCAHNIVACETYTTAWRIANTIDPDHADLLIDELLVVAPVEVS